MCLSGSLKAAIHSAVSTGLKVKKKIITRTAADIRDNVFWKQVYVLLRVFWLMLKTMRLVDTNKAYMDKIHYDMHKACTAMKNSKELLNDVTLSLVNDETHASFGINYNASRRGNALPC